MNEFLNSPALTIFLVCLVPTASCCALNMHFFTTRQMLNSLGIAALLGCILGVGAWWLHGLLAPIAAQHGTLGKALLAGGFGLCVFGVFYALHERFFSETMPRSTRWYAIMAALTIFIGGLSAYAGFLPLNALMVIHLAFSGLDALRNAKRPKEIIFQDTCRARHTVPMDSGIHLQHKPNIYLLLLESYQSPRALHKLYGIEDTLTESLFTQYGFEYYGEVFANEFATVPSLYTLLNGNLLRPLSPEVFTLDVLRENGYECEFFDGSQYAFGSLVRGEEYCSFALAPRVKKLFTIAIPIFCQSRFIRKLVQGVDPFAVEAKSVDTLQNFAQRISHKSAHPRFSAVRLYSMSHSDACASWQQDATAHCAAYVRDFADCQKKLQDTLSLIHKEDPQALVVAVGDHGGLRHYKAWEGLHTPSGALQERGLSLEDLALSIFSVPLAIRWPVPHHARGVLLSHVNIFRYVLAALAEDSSVFKDCKPNVSLVQGMVVVRNGQVLEDFEPYTLRELLETSISEFQTGRANLRECLALFEALQVNNKESALQILEETDKRFPGQTIVQKKLGYLYKDTGSRKALRHLAKARKSAPQDADLVASYVQALCIHKKTKEAQSILDESMQANFSYELMRAQLELFRISGQHAKAKAYSGKLLQKHGDNPESYLQSSKLLVEYGESAEAFVLASRGVAELKHHFYKSEYFQLLVHYTTLCLRHQDAGQAEKTLRDACNFYQSHLWPPLLLSAFLQKQGRLAQAIQVLVERLSFTCNAPQAFIRIGELAAQHKLRNPEFLELIVASKGHLYEAMSLVESKGVFDADWYKARYMESTDSTMPLRHYLSQGVYEGANPTPWFNTFDYLGYWDIWENGTNPFIHYIAHGAGGLRRPSYFTNPAYALSCRQDMPLQHDMVLRSVKKYHAG